MSLGICICVIIEQSRQVHTYSHCDSNDCSNLYMDLYIIGCFFKCVDFQERRYKQCIVNLINANFIVRNIKLVFIVNNHSVNCYSQEYDFKSDRETKLFNIKFISVINISVSSVTVVHT